MVAFILSVVFGYKFNISLTKQGGKINKKLPNIKIKYFQLCPIVSIHLKNKIIRIHHWFAYSIILIITLTVNPGFLGSVFTSGYLVGAIFQGLSFPDWKKFVIQKSNIKI